MFWICGYVVTLNAKIVQCIRADRVDCYKYKSFVNLLFIVQYFSKYEDTKCMTFHYRFRIIQDSNTTLVLMPLGS